METRRQKKNEESLVTKKRLCQIAVVFLTLVCVGAFFLFLLDRTYRQKIYAGVAVGGLDLGGKRQEQARALVQAQADKLTDEGIDFYYNGEKLINFGGVVSAGFASGAINELWFFSPEETARAAYAVGRRGGFWERWRERAGAFFYGRPVKAIYFFKEQDFRDFLRDKLKSWQNPGENASVKFINGKAMARAEKRGMIFDDDEVIFQVKRDLGLMTALPVVMRQKEDLPDLLSDDIAPLLAPAEEAVGLAPVRLKLEKPEWFTRRGGLAKKEWLIGRERLEEWLKVRPDKEIPVRGETAGAALWLEEDKIRLFLGEIAVEADEPAREAKFVIENGRVIEWQSSEDGYRINIEETISALGKAWLIDGLNEVSLILSPDKSKITNENVNDLGIKDLVGLGESDFTGSPKNRRHNIGVGAKTLNGILIKPGEEFSLIKALGEIDEQAGYKPELVIREGRTVPEYGGGLCQIGTTLFRTVINTGLPVTERRNHSYRVSYYEPAGTDATIYNPWPDLKFINDTAHYLLLQTRIEEDRVIFEFWGTKDGRQVEVSQPVIYNIRAPGEVKLIESEELAPGEKRKLESAHNGADADFTRKIFWPDQAGRESVEEVWHSHYVPWREVWLIGKELATSTGDLSNPAQTAN